MPEEKPTAIIIAVVICTAIIVVSATVTLTIRILDRNQLELVSIPEEIDRDDYESRYTRLDEVYERLMGDYYIELDGERLLQGAIDGMMDAVGDPYTFYYTPEQMEKTTTERSSEYVGIGIQVSYTEEGKVVIVRVFAGGPSQLAGLKNYDYILCADGYELVARSSDELTEAVSRIKGEQGTYVNLTIQRGEEVFDVSVLRDSIVTDRVYYGMLDNGIGYIELTDFFGAAVSQTETAVESLISDGASGIIFDLRGNGGGQLDICLDITDLFLSDSLIVYTENRAGERQYYYADSTAIDVPLTVLIDDSSASASEITASALKDNGRAKLFGTTSFGKGIVQSVHIFPGDGAGMQLTTSAYYTPAGNSIHQVGVQPDFTVENGETRFTLSGEDMDFRGDPVVMAAYDYLLNGETDDETSQD